MAEQKSGHESYETGAKALLVAVGLIPIAEYMASYGEPGLEAFTLGVAGGMTAIAIVAEIKSVIQNVTAPTAKK